MVPIRKLTRPDGRPSGVKMLSPGTHTVPEGCAAFMIRTDKPIGTFTTKDGDAREVLADFGSFKFSAPLPDLPTVTLSLKATRRDAPARSASAPDYTDND